MCQTCNSLADGLIIVAQESAGAIKVCLAVDSEEALLSFRDQARRAGALCSYLLTHVLHCRQAVLYSPHVNGQQQPYIDYMTCLDDDTPVSGNSQIQSGVVSKGQTCFQWTNVAACLMQDCLLLDAGLPIACCRTAYCCGA